MYRLDLFSAAWSFNSHPSGSPLSSLWLSISVPLSLPLPASPYLVIGAVLLLAFLALEEASGGAARFGHLVLTDSLLSHSVPQLPQLITGHFLARNKFVLQGRESQGPCPIPGV